MESLPENWRTRNEIQNIDFSLPALTDVQTSFTFTPEEDVSDDTLTNLEVREDIQPEDYVMEISKECEVFQIEPEIVIALNEGENEMKIDVDSDKPKMQQIESKENQPLVVEVRERLQIFYTTDTFVLDEPDTIDSFVLEVPDELLNLKEGMHASLPKHGPLVWSSEALNQNSGDSSDVHVVEANHTVNSIQVARNVTNNFSEHNILGRGGFGMVYKGELHDGTKIDMKRMESRVLREKGLTEFRYEIALVTKVRHHHLVNLVVYCLDGNERLLVYVYMPQGTLSHHLFHWKEEGLKPLEWTRRLTIALDVARGVAYLHNLAQ
ncbi:hypothetical protein Syun_003687 [Stephania yunnanensis]|uniref:Protein kinase domain-containing protein n=1 Tax=Stephania yunnanensis TaxID=152371 RepID=A0AAP0L2L7_9MAGN